MIEKKYITHSREPFFELARPYIQPDSKVLDIGCGSAPFSKYFKSKEFYLFDGNEQTVNHLKKEYKHVSFGMLPELPYDSDFFDVIHCSHVVEHLTPQVFYESLKEMDRCLKRGGYLIVSAPLLWEGFYDDLSHVKPYSPQVIVNYFCSGNSNSRTRDLISTNYKKIDLVNRYHKRKIHFVNRYEQVPYFKGLLLSAIKRIIGGLSVLENSGFTLIIQKTL